MSDIMQGTTPSLTIRISKSDFDVSTATRIELYVQNGGRLQTFKKDALTVDGNKNEITKTFTERETAILDPGTPAIVQARFWFSDGSVVGIQKIKFKVDDMLGV